MGIRMMLEQFPEHRRQYPKRGAEARVFDALQKLGLDGDGLYEYRYRKEGKQWTTRFGCIRWHGSPCR